MDYRFLVFLSLLRLCRQIYFSRRENEEILFINSGSSAVYPKNHEDYKGQIQNFSHGTIC